MFLFDPLNYDQCMIVRPSGVVIVASAKTETGVNGCRVTTPGYEASKKYRAHSQEQERSICHESRRVGICRTKSSLYRHLAIHGGWRGEVVVKAIKKLRVRYEPYSFFVLHSHRF